jgi:hypothetical protein
MKSMLKMLGTVLAVLLCAAAFHAANASEKPEPSDTHVCGGLCEPGVTNCKKLCGDFAMCVQFSPTSSFRCEFA